jgi:HK97 family phage portal protein
MPPAPRQIFTGAINRARAWLQRQLGPGGVNLRLVWPDNWYQGGRDLPGLGRAAALTFPAVYASIDIISSDIARLPMRHWRDDGETRRELCDSWPLSVLDKPNEYQTGFDLMKMLVGSQLFRGNGYLYPIRNRRYQVDSLHCLFPDYVWPYRAAGSDYFYQVSAQPLAEIETTAMIPPREMLHHRMLTFNDPLIGITPMVAAATSSSAGLAILRASDRFFQRMARPSGVLQTARSLDRRKAEEIKERWQRVYAGEEGAGDVAVLEEGLEWKPLTMTAVDAQLIDQLRYSVEDVARVYRVPLFMLGDLTKVSYNSSEQLSRVYDNGCLSAHMKALEWRLSQFFGMDARSEYLEFDTDQLFRGEFQARTEALVRSVQGGLRAPNEARRIEGLNPVPGGDVTYMQQQMVPVSQLASRSDLNPMPAMTPPAAQTPTRELPPPEDNEIPLPGTGPDLAELTDALMGAVFRNPPPARPRQRYADSVLAYRHAQRQLADGRQQPAYH